MRISDWSSDVCSSDLGHQVAFIGAETHGAAEVAAGVAGLAQVAAHPLGEQADHRFGARSELGRAGALDAGEVPRDLDARHLHAEADAEIRNAALAGEGDRGDLALRAALAEAAGQDRKSTRLNSSH